MPRVSQRIDFISRALLGIRYEANTLIGGPKYAERFVVRDDAFDCVTFCEVVLAAAIAPNLGEFESALRRIRYDHGNVQWDQRNHYFADWGKRNIENGICEPVAIEPSVVIDKTVYWHRALGKRQVTIQAIPKAALLEHAKLLSPGDIIGFTSRRSDLDYFHTGLIAFDKDKTLLLRHASQSRGRVIDEKMTTFVDRQSGQIRQPAAGDGKGCRRVIEVRGPESPSAAARLNARGANRPGLHSAGRCAFEESEPRLRPRHHRSGRGSRLPGRRDTRHRAGPDRAPVRRARHGAAGRGDPRSGRAAYQDAQARSVSGPAHLHARRAVSHRRARHRATLLSR